MSKKKNVLSKTLATSGAVLLSVFCAGSYIADDSANAINSALNVKTYREEKKENAEGEDTEYFKSRYNSIAELKKAGNEKCQEAAREGFVLLKNNANSNISNAKALPMTGNKKVSLFSVSSVAPVYSGTGSGSIDTSSAPTLKAALETSGFSVNSTLWDYYATGNGQKYVSKTGYTGKGVKGPKVIGEAPWSEVKAENGSSWANDYNDAAIVVLSRIGGEGSDSPRHGHSLSQLNDSDGSQGDSTDGDYLQLSPKEKALLKGLKSEKDAGVFKRVIVILNFANQIQADFLEDEQYGIDAAMWIGTPGQTGLYALGELLAGSASPSGHLSTTFWADHHQNPSMSNFGISFYEGANDQYYADGTPNQDRVYVVYQEGIYLGYKYTETRYEDYVTNRANVGTFNYDDVVTYPFGYGQSYADFEYSDYKVEKVHKKGDEEAYYEVSVKVKNTSTNWTIPSKDVVQVYLNKPYDDDNNNYNSTYGVEASASELVGFAKTSALAPGKEETVKIKVPERSFASYDAKNAGTYVITGGDYYLSIGNGAHEAINNVLAKKASDKADRMSGKGDAKLCSNKIKLSFDKDTYSTTEETGAKVENIFQNMDYNNYSNKVSSDQVNYVTRNDWNSSVDLNWDGGVVLHYTDKLQADLDSLGRQGDTAIETDKKEYPKMGANNGLQLINLRVDSKGNEIPYDDEAWDALLDQLSWDDMVNTIRSGMRCSEAIASIGKPYCVDHNGPTGLTEKYSYDKNGLATRKDDPDKDKNATCYPSSAILAASFNIDLTYQIGDLIAEDAVWAGYAGLYGPGSNIQRTPYSGRNYEYYSEDAFLSGTISGYECSAMENHGLYVYNKHYALNEIEDMRRGISTWANEQTIRETYLKAFQIPIAMNGKEYAPLNSDGTRGEAIKMRGASGVMCAMNRCGLYWSGMNKSLMTDFLRTECGMTGICVTDMWYGTATPFMNAPAMLIAGTNLVDGGIKAEEFDALKTNHGEAAWAMRESIHRIAYTAVHSIAMNGISNSTVLIPVREWWRNVILGCQIGSGLLLIAGVALYILNCTVLKKQN